MPDFFGYDADLGLQYRGRIYESRNRQRTAGSKRELYYAMPRDRPQRGGSAGPDAEHGLLDQMARRE